jgi:3-methyl-2-oxobutanoate hydroxymethyltransferase
MKPGKLTLPEVAAMKSRGEKIVMVTAYDAPGARLAEQAGIDILLVGDTAAMVVLGHEGTLPVTMDEMLFLTRTVARAVERPLVVGDLPFGSYHVSDEDAVRNAIRFVKEAGADVVKLEGAGPSLSRVRAIVSAGIGVMGHVGLTPQSETILGGFKTQGRTASKARQLLADALALEAAGCFAVVLEAVPVPVAARITEALTVPTIGIGAGPDCDGQVLVYHDLLGLTEGRAPRFVKRYANVAEQIRGALTTYAEEVRNGVYPADEHTYSMPPDELDVFSETFAATGQGVDRSFPTDARAKPARPDDATASGASAEGVEQAHQER